jgi:hypothetical protein
MPRKPKRNDVPIKMDAEVVRWAKVVAAFKDITLAEFVSERAREAVIEDFEARGVEVPAELRAPAKPPRKPRP